MRIEEYSKLPSRVSIKKNEIMFVDLLKKYENEMIVLDGSSTLFGGDFEFDIKINGVNTENELQDIFLEYVEENIHREDPSFENF